MIIKDFTDGKDVLMVLDGSLSTANAQYNAFAKNATQEGDDIVYDTASTTVIIENADLRDFSAADFAFSIGSFGDFYYD